MDNTWLIAGAGVLGTAAWLYSKTTSPENSGDDDTGNSSLSDNKPRWGSRARVGLEYITGSNNLYTTSCGWSPEEEYCPDSVLNACSVNCLEPYLATTFSWFGANNSQNTFHAWQGGGNALTDEDIACYCSPIRPMKGGAAIRVRPQKLSKPIQDKRFYFTIEVQGMIRQQSSGRCQRSGGGSYNWDAVPSGIRSGLAFTSIEISPRTGYKASLEWMGDEKEYNYNGLYLDNTWNSGNTTYFRFGVASDAFELLGSGWAELDLTLMMDRDHGGKGESWLETCEFTETITYTVPDFVFIDNSDCESGCPQWKIDDWNIAKVSAGRVVKHYLPSDAPSRITDTWNDAEKAAKYDNYTGTTAQTDPTVLNAETIFPRNGHAVF